MLLVLVASLLIGCISANIERSVEYVYMSEDLATSNVTEYRFLSEEMYFDYQVADILAVRHILYMRYEEERLHRRFFEQTTGLSSLNSNVLGVWPVRHTTEQKPIDLALHYFSYRGYNEYGCNKDGMACDQIFTSLLYKESPYVNVTLPMLEHATRVHPIHGTMPIDQ